MRRRPPCSPERAAGAAPVWISGAAKQLPSVSAPEMPQGQGQFAASVAVFRTPPKAVIAAVNGPAAGAGFALALAAGIGLAAPEARFNTVFVRVGLSAETSGPHGCCRAPWGWATPMTCC